MSLMKRTRKRKEASRVRLNEQASLFAPHEAGELAPEAATERTHKVSQREIAESVADAARRNAWDLDLPDDGPLGVSSSRNGRFALVHGASGYVGTLDLHSNKTLTELRLGEAVRDACYLHDETMFAVAQRKFLYVYDSTGTELHRLKQHVEPEHVAFLPYHFLLATSCHSGHLKYLDVSTGTAVSDHATKLGSALSLALNPQTAVLHLGHSNGVVTLWSPASPQPLARILAHRGGVSAMAVATDGSHFVTAGVDGFVKVWDARSFKAMHEKKLKTAVASMDVSQRGFFGVATLGGEVNVYRDARTMRPFEPYLHHALGGGRRGRSLRFRPFEDAVLVGHSRGVASLLTPGAAEANYDSLEGGANPYRTRPQRQSATVRSLLEKLAPETIGLEGDGFVGAVDRDPAALDKERRALQADAEAHNAAHKGPKKARKKMRGRSKIAAQLKKKAKNVISHETVALREKLATEKADRAAKRAKKTPTSNKGGGHTSNANSGEPTTARETKSALDRIFGK